MCDNIVLYFSYWLSFWLTLLFLRITHFILLCMCIIIIIFGHIHKFASTSLNVAPCFGLVRTLAYILSVGQWVMDTSLWSTLSFLHVSIGGLGMMNESGFDVWQWVYCILFVDSSTSIAIKLDSWVLQLWIVTSIVELFIQHKKSGGNVFIDLNSIRNKITYGSWMFFW